MFSPHTNNSTIGCADYSEVLAHVYGLRGSVEWSTLLSVRILFTLLYTTILIGGLLCNGSVIRILLSAPNLTARNTLLLNLMCADLVICLTNVPITPLAIFWKRWILGEFLCRCLPFTQSTAVMVISWTLAAIAVDKFVHIHDPGKLPVHKTEASWMVLGSWSLALTINLPFAFNYRLKSGSQMDPESPPFCGHFCVEDWWTGFQRFYGTFVLMVHFVAPMLLIGYCYARILYIVHNDLLVSRRKYSSLLSKIQHQRAGRLQRKATYILVAGVLGFLLAWSPLTAINVLKDYEMVPNFVREQVYFCGLVSHSIAMSSVILNPILCFWLTRQSTTTLNREDSVPLHLYTVARKGTYNSEHTTRQRDKYVEGGSLIVCESVTSLNSNDESH